MKYYRLLKEVQFIDGVTVQAGSRVAVKNTNTIPTPKDIFRNMEEERCPTCRACGPEYCICSHPQQTVEKEHEHDFKKGRKMDVCECGIVAANPDLQAVTATCSQPQEKEFKVIHCGHSKDCQCNPRPEINPKNLKACQDLIDKLLEKKSCKIHVGDCKCKYSKAEKEESKKWGCKVCQKMIDLWEDSHVYDKGYFHYQCYSQKEEENDSTYTPGYLGTGNHVKFFEGNASQKEECKHQNLVEIPGSINICSCKGCGVTVKKPQPKQKPSEWIYKRASELRIAKGLETYVMGVFDEAILDFLDEQFNQN